MFLVPILKLLTAYFAPVLTYISELWLWSNPTQVWKITFGAIIVLMFDFFYEHSSSSSKRLFANAARAISQV